MKSSRTLFARHSGVAIASLITMLTCTFADAHERSEVVHTDKGIIIGATTTAGRQFLGIPYAAPPKGALRWRAPQPTPSWHKPREAKQFGNSCPQFASPFGLPSVDEDCLYLNVYTPHIGKGAHHNPVMVWLHPGAFQYGEGEDYDPRQFVERGVVVVTVNYRLGALGFLAHPALTAESSQHTSGNYGLMDQQAALQWVRRNIAHFGGDPENVTIFGESAGGMSVHAHLASPKSRGLFDRAIVQSGAYSMTQSSLATAEAGGVSFATAAGCAPQDLACLRGLSVETVLAKQQPGILGFLPNVDGVVLPQSVNEALSSGRFNRVPVMQGSTQDEYRLFVPLFFDFNTGPLTADLYPVGISILLGVPFSDVPTIMARYPLSNYSSPAIALSALATDAVFACHMQTATQNLARFVPTYVYEFADVNAPQRYLPPASFPYGAAHESELQYLFDIVTTLPAQALNADQQKLSRTMITYWSNFAYTGNPNIGPKGLAAPIWWRHNYTDYVHRLDAPTPQPSTGSAFAIQHQCAFWSAFDSH